MAQTCEGLSCALPATVYFSAFEERTCIADHRFCEGHAKDFLATFYPRSRAGVQPPARLDDAIPFSVDATIYDAKPATPNHAGGYILLTEVGGIRRVNIATGPVEAWTLRSALLDNPPPPTHPLPHQAMLSAICALGGTVQFAIIDGLDERAHRYIAKLRIVQDGRIVQCAVRASDGVVLAVLADVPILVAHSVLIKLRHQQDSWRDGSFGW